MFEAGSNTSVSSRSRAPVTDNGKSMGVLSKEGTGRFRTTSSNATCRRRQSEGRPPPPSPNDVFRLWCNVGPWILSLAARSRAGFRSRAIGGATGAAATAGAHPQKKTAQADPAALPVDLERIQKALANTPDSSSTRVSARFSGYRSSAKSPRSTTSSDLIGRRAPCRTAR